MPSKINTTNIDTQYPVPGVNNPTQGFRNNWTAITNNLNVASSELSDLMNKAVLTSPLTDGNTVVSNNLNSMPMAGGVYRSQSLAIVSHGSLTATGTETFDFSLGAVHTVTLNGNSAVTTVNPTNFPGNGYSEIEIQVTVSNTSHTLSFPLTQALQVPGFSGNVITFSNAATYSFKLSSVDGSAWFLEEKWNPTAVALQYTPSNAYGAAGDTVGKVAFDSNYIYVCKGNYTGNTKIWVRAALSSW